MKKSKQYLRVGCGYTVTFNNTTDQDVFNKTFDNVFETMQMTGKYSNLNCLEFSVCKAIANKMENVIFEQHFKIKSV